MAIHQASVRAKRTVVGFVALASANRGAHNHREVSTRVDLPYGNASPRLPESENYARLLHIVENVSDFVSLAGPDNNVNYINPAGRALLEMGDAESVAGLRLIDFHPPASARSLESEALPAAVRDGVWTGESVILTKTGREIAVSQILIARRTPDGRLESVAAIMRDIRKRKHREAALQLSEERFQILVDTMIEGFVVMDRHGVLEFASKRFAQMLGHLPKDLIGRALLDFVDPAQRESIAERIDACEARDRLVFEAPLTHADGRTQPARVVLRRFAVTDAGAAGSCAVIGDVSPHLQLERALRTAEDNVRHLSCQILTVEEAERKRIADDLHDDLGQSLCAIKFGLEEALTAIEQNAIDATRCMLESLVFSIRNTVDDLRRLAMNLRPLTLDDLGALATLRWFLREFASIYRTIAIEEEFALSERDVPDSLKLALFRVLQEAMHNVAKHSHATLVRIRAERVGGALRLIITDNGVGFDPAEVAARSGWERRHGHVGLKDRVEFNGGTLAIDAAPGQGVCLRISWPCDWAGAGGSGPSTTAEDPSGARRFARQEPEGGGWHAP
jgi:PAS domain S-box-containing protein